MSARLKHGAWTWVKYSDEVWALSDTCREALGSRWVLKDYGQPQGPLERIETPFKGWRLVGGGPFGPEHASLTDAAEFARVALTERALAKKRALQAQIDAIDAVLEA